MLPKVILKNLFRGVISFIAVCILTYLDILNQLIPTENFYSTMASISGVLAGFVLVGVTILHALPDIEIYKELQKFRSFKQSYSVYYFTFIFLLTVLALSIIGGIGLKGNVIFGYLVLALFLISVWLVYSCFWILKKLAELRFS